MSFRIVPVRSAGDIAAAVGLFRAYAATLPVDLAFQDFDDELAAMPGKYAPPKGALFLARRDDGTAIGCAGLRPLDASCEIKRLYFAPEGRGFGIGRALLAAIVEAAERIGYRQILLDTLPTMTEAQRIYRQAGFVDIPPYYDTPVEGTVFLARRL